MKENFIHVCFIIDESGSMYCSVGDVIGGFKRVVDEQKANPNGTCSMSLFKFASKVEEIFKGKDVNEVEYLNEHTYKPGGSTAMNDGIGTAIDTIGKWLDGMPESEKPEKNLIVIMTDGEENSSKEYTFGQVKEMIARQENEWNWDFMYLGTDVAISDARSLGIQNVACSIRSRMNDTYSMVGSIVSSYRNSIGDIAMKCKDFASNIKRAIQETNATYKEDTGIDIDKDKDSK